MIRVLYVEDNDDNIYMLKLRFELIEGFEMLVAENGATGYDKAVTEKPDVILMDLDLPVMDGWEASRQLKSNLATRHIPIIALTAHAMSGSTSSLSTSIGFWIKSILFLQRSSPS